MNFFKIFESEYEKILRPTHFLEPQVPPITCIREF